MQHLWTLLAMVLCLATLNSDAATLADTIAKSRSLRDEGHFKQAEVVLSTALKREGEKLSADEQKKLRHELDLIDWIRQDFSHTKDRLFEALNKAVFDLTTAEFESWLKEGRFESRKIDGAEHFSGTSVSNLFWRYPALNSRRKVPRDKAGYYQALWDNARAIRKAAEEEKNPYVLPHRFRMTMTVTVEAGVVPGGQTVRCWIPIPRKYPYPFQQDFKMLNSSSPVKYLAEETSPIRSAYLEQTAGGGQPIKFQIAYEHGTHARYFDLKAEESEPLPDDASLKPFLQESPHVAFTDKVKKLSAKIVGTEKNPVRKAKAIYDWVGNNLFYSYALEYSTIPNISEYTLEKGWGDCGQQALTFITLCRSQGIPARWQSGWYLFPSSKNIHDWSEIYLAPWGWVPVDPEFGNAILRYATNLLPDERKELHDFYFGGLDQYRMAANSDHSQELQPPKKTWRSDDVDFQRGELESDDKNIFFKDYNYNMQIEYLSPK